jgi:hypothetical protein
MHAEVHFFHAAAASPTRNVSNFQFNARGAARMIFLSRSDAGVRLPTRFGGTSRSDQCRIAWLIHHREMGLALQGTQPVGASRLSHHLLISLPL